MQFKAQFDKDAQIYQDRAKAVQAKMELYKKEVNLPGKSDAEKENIQKEMVRLQRELEDISNEAKANLGKKADDETVQAYKEIQDMASRYAAARGYDLVLTYNDFPAGDPGVFQPANVSRKMQTPPLLPLYVSPGMDITNEVLGTLNQAYPAKPATPTTPAAGTGTTPAPK
jgi:Skp family chaperone for outer membrane proteins